MDRIEFIYQSVKYSMATGIIDLMVLKLFER
jgi:hypothetical protein